MEGSGCGWRPWLRVVGGALGWAPGAVPPGTEAARLPSGQHRLCPGKELHFSENLGLRRFQGRPWAVMTQCRGPRVFTR